MRRKLVLAAMVIAVSAVGVWLVFAGHRREWTTASPEALVEFDKGLDSLAKVYYAEAAEHFARAVELDPSFAIAKRFLLMSGEKWDKEKVGSILDELTRVDLTTLSPRERFLIRYDLAVHNRKNADAQRSLDEYLAEFPEDPWALSMLGTRAVSAQEWDTAQQVFTKLVEVAPNRVEAYNELGYLAMAQERFQDSENMFRTYRYLAPDQANPRDSLGELLAVTGRYAEAEREFYGAVEVRPDFCVSYEHVVLMSFLDRNAARAASAVERARKAGVCPAPWLAELSCTARLVEAVEAGSWEKTWQAGLDTCADSKARSSFVRFAAAAYTGRQSETEVWIAKYREALEKNLPESPSGRRIAAHIAHLEGVVLLAANRPNEAAARFAATDRVVPYRGLDEGAFKLFNRLAWVGALQAGGDRTAADRVGAETSRVNPHVVAAWQGMEAPRATPAAAAPSLQVQAGEAAGR